MNGSVHFVSTFFLCAILRCRERIRAHFGFVADENNGICWFFACKYSHCIDLYSFNTFSCCETNERAENRQQCTHLRWRRRWKAMELNRACTKWENVFIESTLILFLSLSLLCTVREAIHRIAKFYIDSESWSLGRAQLMHCRSTYSALNSKWIFQIQII